MSITFYDASVKSYQQVVNATAGFMDKCGTHCAENAVGLDDVVDTCLHPDMLSFHFQIFSVMHHSIGAINGMIAGEFGPSKNIEKMDFAGLHALIKRTQEQLDALSPDSVNALSDGQTIFKLGELEMPFTNENFLLSFSLPNFYFHAATAYDILRHVGVPVGKRDFLGQMRMGV